MVIQTKKNTKRNVAIGILNKVVLLILPFILRSVIVNTIGVEYLGLNSLFSSIIQVLSLSELGLSSALVYHMYKPIAEDDQKTLNALLNLYKKAYRIIGCITIVIGLIILPFLPYLINGDYPSEISIHLLFLIYIINTSISYFLFGYKQSLLVAYQREDINSFINLVVQFGLIVVQILLLIITRNYLLYIVCLPVFTIINNLWIGIITKKMFPEAVAAGTIETDTLKEIIKMIAGTFIQKACAITRNSLDSICISCFLGLAVTAIYNNYFVIFSGLTTLMGVVETSLQGGIGNHVVVKSSEENFEELKKLDFIYMVISGVCTVCLLCLYQPFMKLWMGKNLMLPFGAVILMCVYFYVRKMGDIKYLYNNANGLWWKLKWRSVTETIVNVVLNIVLGKLLGVYGIILATIISIVTCSYIWGATVLFKEYFGKRNMYRYFVYHIRYLVVTAVVCAITFFTASMVDGFFIKLPLVLVESVILFCLVYFKTVIFKESVKMIK